jgi:general secretion pathway protein C
MKKMIIDIDRLIIWLHKHSQQMLCAVVIFPTLLLFICTVNTYCESIRDTNVSSTLVPAIADKVNVNLNMDDGSHEGSLAVAKSAATTVAPVSLALTLTGIIASDDRVFSQAIITSQGGPRNYNQGEYIEGLSGVFIEKIDINTVRINNNGTSQLMTLLDEDPTPPSKAPEQTKKTRFLSDFIISNPVYENEKLTGVKLYPRGAASRFTRLGFKSGDIALKINNHILSEPEGMKAALNELSTLGSAQFTVLRNSNEKLINASTMDVE